MDFCYLAPIRFRLPPAASNLPLVSSFLIFFLAEAPQSAARQTNLLAFVPPPITNEDASYPGEIA